MPGTDDTMPIDVCDPSSSNSNLNNNNKNDNNQNASISMNGNSSNHENEDAAKQLRKKTSMGSNQRSDSLRSLNNSTNKKPAGFDGDSSVSSMASGIKDFLSSASGHSSAYYGKQNSLTQTLGGSDPKKCCNISRTVLLRVLLTVSLLVAIGTCTVVSFSVVRNAELEVARLTYMSIAGSALEGAQAITLRKVQGSEVMATVMAQIFPDADQWPLIVMDGYMPIAQKVAQLTTATTQSLMVLLDLKDNGTPTIAEFEDHTWNVYRDQNQPEEAGVSNFGYGVWMPDQNKENCTFEDCRLHDNSTDRPTSWAPQRDISVPIMMHNDPAASSLLYNLYSEANRGVHIDSMLDCVDRFNARQIRMGASPQCAVITDIVELKVRPGPAGLLFQPIFPAHDPTKIVGFATTTLHWEEVLTTTFPDFVSGITCVVSTATKTYTYEIRNGLPRLLGEGDLHNEEYTDMGQSVVLNPIEMETGAMTSATYRLTVYPTAEMFDSFSTNSPVAVSCGFFGVVAFCALVFVLYDYLMRHEAHERKAIMEMKRRFVRFISHEIRTPLNTVCMGLELLESELKRTSEKDANTHSEDEKVDQDDVDFWFQVTHDIGQNAQTAVEILNDLLNYDKLESGTLTLEPEAVCVYDLVERTVQQFQIQAINRKVDLKLDSERPPALSERPHALSTTPEDSSGSDVECGGGVVSGDHLTVLGDDVKLGQVLRNLTSNALKFTPAEGTIDVTTTFIPDGLPDAAPILLPKGGEDGEDIWSSIYPRAGSIQITVKDSGIGLTKDQLAQLFTEGVQFDANRLQHGGGSGLGLCIAKGIVEQHSGTLHAESEGQGHGTAFVVELPLYRLTSAEMKRYGDFDDINKNPQSTTATAATSTDMTSDEEEVKFKARRILVAEDAVSSLKMLIRVLERAGHSCVPAENGKQAVEAIAKDLTEFEADPHGHEPFDTILIDFEMPILKGPDATEKIRNMGFAGTIVGVTGNILSEDVEYFKSHGADEVLPKPISLARINAFWDKQSRGDMHSSFRRNMSGSRRRQTRR